MEIDLSDLPNQLIYNLLLWVFAEIARFLIKAFKNRLYTKSDSATAAIKLFNKKTLRKQFYICLVVNLICMPLANSKNTFFQPISLVLGFLSLFFLVSAFEVALEQMRPNDAAPNAENENKSED